MSEDPLDIILRLIGLRSFIAGTTEAAASVRRVGVAAEESGAAGAAGMGRMSRMMGVVGMAAKGAVALVVAAGYESSKMAINFDKQMEMVHTQAGASQAEVARQSKNILAMTKTGNFAQGPQQMAEGLFHLESIGLRGAKALNALKIASQGAAVGGANLEDVTTALGSAWLVNIKGAGSLQNVMGILNATVGAGNMKMGELVSALGTGILPAAKNAGLSIKDVMGAMAVFTDEGYQASSAAAQMGTALHFLSSPTAKAAKALAGMGMSSSQMAQDMHKPNGLLTALTDLHSHLAKLPGGVKGVAAEQTINSILPGGRGRIMLTLLNQLDRYHMKLGQISKNTGNIMQDITATHQTASFKIHAAWAQIQSYMVDLGHALEPVAVWFTQGAAKVVGALALIPNAVRGIISWFHSSGGAGGGWLGSTWKTIVKVANQIAGTFSKLWTHSLKPFFTQIGSAAQKAFNGQFAQAVGNIIRHLATFAGTVAKVAAFVIKGALPGILNAFKGAFNIISGIVKFISNLLSGHFSAAFHDLGQIVKGVGQLMYGVFQTLVLAPIKNIGVALGWLWHNVFEPVAKFLEEPFKVALVIAAGLFTAMNAPVAALVAGVAGLMGGLGSLVSWVAGAGQTVLNFFNALNPFSGGGGTGIPSLTGSGITGTGTGLPTSTPSVLNTPLGTGPVKVATHQAGHNVSFARTGAFSGTKAIRNFSPKWEAIVQINKKEIARAAGSVVHDELAFR